MQMDPRAALRAIFDAAVAAADPRKVLAAHLPEPPLGRTVVVGAGKSAALMAAALEAVWPVSAPLSGAVVTRYGHGVPTSRIEVLEAAHPVPDANSERAADRMLELVRDLTPDDLVIALISGGGSALLAKPAPGLTLAQKQARTEELLRSGATIHEMNEERKRLSAIKGGKLALAARPARVVTLAISDVPGNEPGTIASGPTVIPGETPDFHFIATPAMALEAAAARAIGLGLETRVLGELEGESRDLGARHAAFARSLLPADRPLALISGGETVVTIGDAPLGRGGRNMEYLLALAIGLDDSPGIWAVAGDTDGRDGSEDAAGAYVTPDTLKRATAAGIDAQKMLEGHDSFTFFDAIGDVLHTGPTLTNVNALRAIIIA
jgi:glycerate 2-kinase